MTEPHTKAPGLPQRIEMLVCFEEHVVGEFLCIPMVPDGSQDLAADRLLVRVDQMMERVCTATQRLVYPMGIIMHGFGLLYLWQSRSGRSCCQARCKMGRGVSHVLVPNSGNSTGGSHAAVLVSWAPLYPRHRQNQSISTPGVCSIIQHGMPLFWASVVLGWQQIFEYQRSLPVAHRLRIEKPNT